MRAGNLVECIDGKFTPSQSELVPNRPSKGSIYEVRKSLLTRNGRAILLVEIENPLLKDPATKLMFEPSFSVKRFVIIDPESGNQIKEELSEILENELTYL